MGFMDRFKTDDEDYIRLDKPQEEERTGPLLVEVEKMTSYADSDRIQRKLRDGNVLLVKVKDLRTKDVTELRRAVDRVKKTCMAIDGDIAGVGEDWLVVTGPKARVTREEEN